MASDRMFRNLAIPAVRYALGRRTYIVGDVCEAIEYHADLLSPEERATIVRDINERDGGQGGLGMAQDAYRWRALRAALGTSPWNDEPCHVCGGYMDRPHDHEYARPEGADPSCCELACYEDEGCMCDGCAAQPAPDPLREAARAFVDIWGETEAMESSHAFRALRAAIEEADRG